MRANYGTSLRHWLKEQCIGEIIDFGDLQVFQGATTYPCIIRIAKSAPRASFEVTQVKTLDFRDLGEYIREDHYSLNQSELDDKGWSLADERTAALLAKIRSRGVPLGEYVGGKIYNGIKTGLNEAFVIDSDVKKQLIYEDPMSAEVIKPFLIGKDIKRYFPPKSNNYLIYIPWHFPLQNNQEIVSASSVAEAQFEKKYPAIFNHMLKFKPKLAKRDKAETNIKYEWYALQRPRPDYYNEFKKPKIIIPTIVRRASYTYDRTGIYSNDKTSIIPTDDLYLLGILGSQVADIVIHSISSTKQGGYFEYKPMYVSQIPIRTIDFSDPADIARHDRMVSLVERMLDLHKQLPEAATPHEKTALERQIEATDGQIDALVYELYGLTEEEIRIVEEASG